MKTLPWTKRLELELERDGALRVLDKNSIARMAQVVTPAISEATIDRWVAQAVMAGHLQRVVRGLFLNRLTFPKAQACEAAVWLRPGAVVSLQTVLGDSGVWNNYTDWITAIVPLSPMLTTPSLGRFSTHAGTFVFRGMPEAMLDAGVQKDRLAWPSVYRRATPEAALLHWLYLARSPRSGMSPPPAELDFQAMDPRRLVRLARAMKLVDALQAWVQARP